MIRGGSILLLAALSSRILVAQASGAGVLDPDKIELESLFNVKVITASKFPENLVGAPGVVSVVSADEILRFGAMTVGEALERVPGLVAATNYMTDRNMVRLRADTIKENSGHILVLINGRPAREVQEGGVISDLLQSFPVSALERIEVIRGPGSVLYGSNAFSGVINLITKRVRASSVTMRGYAVSPGAGGGSSEVMFRKGKLELLAAAQTRFEPARRVTLRQPEFVPLLGAQAPLTRYATVEQGTGAYLGVNYGNLRFSGSYTDSLASMFTFTTGEGRLQRGFMNLGYTLKPAARWEMSLDLTHTINRLGMGDFPYVRRAGSDTVAEWTNILTLGGRDRVIAGALFNYVEGSEWYAPVEPGERVANGSRRAGAFYAQLEHRFDDRFKWIGGVQGNRIGNLALETVPRTGLIWTPAGRFSVKTLFGHAYRAPSINELYLKHPLLSGNANLLPEHIRTLDVSASYLGSRFQASATYFNSRQANVIRRSLVDDPTYAHYVNSGSMHNSGVELGFRQYLTERFFWNVTAFSAHFHADEERLPIPLVSPKWGGTTGLSYQDKSAWTLSLLGVFRGSTAESTLPGFQWQPSRQVNAHARFELSKLLGEAGRGLALYAHGINLANQKVWYPEMVQLAIPHRGGRVIYYGLEVALSRE